MPIDGFVGTALGGLALMVFGAVLIWISLGSPVAVLTARTTSDGYPARSKSDARPRGATSPERAARSIPSPTDARHSAARAARQRLDDALLAITLLDTVPLDSRHLDAYAPDPSPFDDYAFDPARFDPCAGDAVLLRESLAHGPEDDDFYCVAAIVARCAETSNARSSPAGYSSATPHRAIEQRTPVDRLRPTPAAGYVTAFAGSLSTHARSAA